jgi:hypothetical protein
MGSKSQTHDTAWRMEQQTIRLLEIDDENLQLELFGKVYQLLRNQLELHEWQQTQELRRLKPLQAT